METLGRAEGLTLTYTLKGLIFKGFWAQRPGFEGLVFRVYPYIYPQRTHMFEASWAQRPYHLRLWAVLKLRARVTKRGPSGFWQGSARVSIRVKTVICTRVL